MLSTLNDISKYSIFVVHAPGKMIMFKSMLDAECNEGTYGYNCTNKCSGHCLNNSPCNKQTGHCDGGCNPGYTNSNCSEGKFTDPLVAWLMILLNDNHHIIFQYYKMVKKRS